MTFVRLLLRNLAYHWRGNLAVFLGVILGSAVLTGALLVGDSLRGSLRSLSLDQLGWVENAMLPGRFFRAKLAGELNFEKRCAVLLLQGSVSRKDAQEETQRAGKVTVLGVDTDFWPASEMPIDAEFWNSDRREIVLNETLAAALGAKVEDVVQLHLERADAAPRETILAQRKAENVIERIRVTVKKIVPDAGMGRFSLKPSPLPVRNAFVPIRLLQTKLDLAGRANAILAAGNGTPDLPKALTLDDWGLRYRSPRERAEAFIQYLDPNNDEGKVRKARWNGRLPPNLAEEAEKNNKLLTRDQVVTYYEGHRDYWVLESQRMLLEPMVIEAMTRLVPNLGKGAEALPRWNLTPRLIYLADSLSDGKHEVPYAIVASDDTTVIVKDETRPLIQDDQILLMKWPESVLSVKPGDPLTLTYYAPDANNHHVKKTITFKVHPLLEDIAGVRDDPDLTPAFPGITDKLDIADWVNPPFEFDRKRVKKPDEDYWKRYRTTPRAYVSLAKAQELWKSRFGDVTSIQVRLGQEHPSFLPAALLAELKPERGGFEFQRVREQALKASAGSTDFGVLFLSFSFFLIVAALLLVGLLVRLNLDRRASEMGLLLATGWAHGQVRRLLLGEGACLTILGAFVGLGGAMLYAEGMLKLLIANWPGGQTLQFLRLHVEIKSFAIGYFASVLVSVATLALATRSMSHRSPRSLLSGETVPSMGLADDRPGWTWWLIPVCTVSALALALSARFMPSHEAQAGSFFGSGALLLTACLVAIAHGLKRSSLASSPQPTLTRLGLRNAGRHVARSVLTVGLLASASFLIVAVESFRKDADQHFFEKSGGSGGFAFFAEGNVPVFEDLTRKSVRADHGLDQAAQFFPCRLQPGDDASCLGLYKPLKPRVMGMSEALIDRGGFSFAGSLAESEEEKANPWLLLRKSTDGAIPAIVDATTAQWVLNVKLGGTLEVNDEQGKPVTLKVVALLAESIFQSEILISEASFLKVYPQQTGFSFYLIDTGNVDSSRKGSLAKNLERGMDHFGMDVQTTASRLQAYVAVENMYLVTFQALGGLGLILGAAGLAIVLLRGVWERRGELALLLALGFRSRQLARLVLAENALLLTLGLAAGTVSALLAVAPHLVGAGAQVLWLRIVGLLALVLVVGLVAATLAVWSTLRTPVLTALRRE